METAGRYQDKTSCNNCGEYSNEIRPKSFVDNCICECETICKKCGHKDYWAYGSFESRQDGLDKSKRY